jgi:hypothetical protein
VDAFNILMRVNYAAYVGTLSSPFFGRAIAAQPPRRVQLSAGVTSSGLTAAQRGLRHAG